MSRTAVAASPPNADLAVLWLEVAPRVECFLARLGCPAADREDVMQDLAIRLLDSAVSFEKAGDLMPWACTVSRNLYLDLLRHQSRHPQAEIDLLAERPGHVDVARHVEQRLALASVLSAIRLLPLQQRQLLSSAEDAAGPVPAGVRMQRHRLLRRLLKSSGGLLAVAILLASAPPLPHSHAQAGVTQVQFSSGLTPIAHATY